VSTYIQYTILTPAKKKHFNQQGSAIET